MNGGVPPEGLPPADSTQERGIRIERDPALLVETMVRAEIELLPAKDKMPGLTAAALAMARILDDPTSIPQHPGAASRLEALLERVRRGAVAAGQVPAPGDEPASGDAPAPVDGAVPAGETMLERHRREARERRDKAAKAAAGA